MPLKTETVKSGLASLDEVIQGLRYGDNVVWQVDHLEEYIYFAEPFASQAIARWTEVHLSPICAPYRNS